MADKKQKTHSQIGAASRRKGAAGELEVAHILQERGYTDAKRSAQHCGYAAGDADVENGPKGCHLEVKRCEKGSLYEWLRQAIRDSAVKGKTPVVVHRKNNEEWVAILRFSDFLDLVDKAGGTNGKDHN